MDNKMTRFEKICFGMCIALLITFSATIVIRCLTRQILIEKLKWNNVVTRIIWFDNPVAGNWGNENEDVSHEIDTNSSYVEIDWESRYPFSDENSSLASKNQLSKNDIQNPFLLRINAITNEISSIKEKVSTYTEELLIGYYFEVDIAKKYDKLLGLDKIQEPTTNNKIIYLNNGYLTYTELEVEENNINKIADSVADFSKYLYDKGISFCYVNVGSKVCPYDKQTRIGSIEYSNENGDALLKALGKRSINYLDMRERMLADGLDWYGSYYIADHHWKTETGLWAAKQLGLYLNNEFGYNFNISLFDQSNYEMTTTDNFWLGGQGREVTLANAKLESYTKIIPKFETNFHVEVPEKGIFKDGCYEDTLFDNEKYERIFDYTKGDYLLMPDAYHSVTWTNDGLGIIRNNNVNSNSGKKILFIQDSFSWYLTTFLACDIDAVDLMHPSEFTGSIRTYINETKPDMVVVMLCEANINKIDDTGYSAIFDLK